MSKRENIFKMVIRLLVKIQKISGRKVLKIDEEMVPIGGLPGFDSLNGLELTLMLPDKVAWSGKSLCVSDDGKRALSVKEMVERLLQSDTKTD